MNYIYKNDFIFYNEVEKIKYCIILTETLDLEKLEKDSVINFAFFNSLYFSKEFFSDNDIKNPFVDLVLDQNIQKKLKNFLLKKNIEINYPQNLKKEDWKIFDNIKNDFLELLKLLEINFIFQ